MSKPMKGIDPVSGGLCRWCMGRNNGQCICRRNCGNSRCKKGAK